MGKIIDNYNIQQELGSGVYSRVYKAINMKTKQLVAIKMVKVQKFRQLPKLQQGTINQINILSNLQPCEHIIKYYDMLKTVNNFYFVYEFCNGGTLEHMLKKVKRFQQPQALKYYSQIIEGFKVLNKHNIIHRDLKPQNLLLNDGIIKIADFGFCKVLQNPNEMVQTMLGSPIYMAPQILKGETYTLKADIWSLGVILYRMLYGVCPFESASIAKLILTIENNDLQFPDDPKISPIIVQLLKRMLVKDYNKRADWSQVFSYEISQNKMLKRSKDKDQPFLIKNNSVVMHSSTTVTQDQGNYSSYGYQSMHRFNTDSNSLGQQINAFNGESGGKSSSNKIKLKSRPSLKEDSKEFFASFKNNKPIYNTTSGVTQTHISKMKQPSQNIMMCSSGNVDYMTYSSNGYQNSHSLSVNHGLNKSGIRQRSATSKIDSYSKNHPKYVDLIGLCLEISKYDTQSAYSLAYNITKGLQKQWSLILESVKKECLKDYQNIQAQQVYGIIMQELQFLKTTLQMYEKQITLWNIDTIQKNKKALLKEFVHSLRLNSIEELVMASRLVDYIDQSLLIRKETYAKLSKQQLTRQINSKFGKQC